MDTIPDIYQLTFPLSIDIIVEVLFLTGWTPVLDIGIRQVLFLWDLAPAELFC